MISLWQAHASFAMLIFLLLPSFGLNTAARIGVLFVLLACSFIPIEGLSLAAYLRSYIDDLAITSMVLMFWGCLRKLGVLTPAPQSFAVVLMLFAAMAVVLYPATLGLSYLDPYRYGYSPRGMLVVFGLLTLGLFYLRNRLAVVMLASATLGFLIGIKPSHNYWDYLVDPLLGVFCCLALMILAVRSLYRYFRRDNPQRLAL